MVAKVNKTIRRRALLDTNVWRYIIDSEMVGDFILHADAGCIQIQIAPAVVYETLRLKDSSKRRALLNLMTNSKFERLMPEAYSKSFEVLSEIGAKHPNWFRKSPDLQYHRQLYKDWSRKTGGFWVRCIRDPEKLVRHLSSVGQDVLLDRTRAQAEYARQEMVEAQWKVMPPLDEMLVGLKGSYPGWNGDPFHCWRLDTLTGLTFGLATTGNAYRDWIGPFLQIDTGLLGSAAWNKFWIYEADPGALPRQWMRWAHSFSQRFRKVTPGTPGDAQLSTHFVETDLVITADKALVEILDHCRRYAPVALAKGQLIEGGRDGVQTLLDLMRNGEGGLE